jgi:hypothetical protein
LLRCDGELSGVITADATDEGIGQVLWLLNPAKLGAAGPARIE